MKIRVIISGRQYDLAQAIPDQLTLPAGCKIDAALEVLDGLLPPGSRIPDSCLIAVSGTHLGSRGRHQDQVLCEGDELLVLVPIAGG